MEGGLGGWGGWDLKKKSDRPTYLVLKQMEVLGTNCGWMMIESADMNPHMKVSQNSGSLKSSVLTGFSTKTIQPMGIPSPFYEPPILEMLRFTSLHWIEAQATIGGALPAKWVPGTCLFFFLENMGSFCCSCCWWWWWWLLLLWWWWWCRISGCWSLRGDPCCWSHLLGIRRPRKCPGTRAKTWPWEKSEPLRTVTVFC